METERLLCKPGNHHWDRPITRGRKPTACPEHRVQPEPGKRKLTKEEKVEAMHAGARKKREQEAKEKRQAERQELRDLKKQLPSIVRQYEKAFNAAVKVTDLTKIKTAFDKADIEMGRVQGVETRIRQLEAKGV